MGWKQNDDGTWCFTHREGESWEEAFQRCMKGNGYTADEATWMALLVLATDFIGARLNPEAMSRRLGSSLKADLRYRTEDLPSET